MLRATWVCRCGRDKTREFLNVLGAPNHAIVCCFSTRTAHFYYQGVQSSKAQLETAYASAFKAVLDAAARCADFIHPSVFECRAECAGATTCDVTCKSCSTCLA